MFIWSARTLVNALNEYLPKTAALLRQIADSYGTRKFEKTFIKLFPQCENISIDYAVLEPRSAMGEEASGIYCIPAEFGWNDLGSWSALYEHRVNGRVAERPNVIEAQAHFTVDAAGNYIHAPQKFVAAVGVENIVVVETKDALLVTTRERAQDVGKIVKHLSEKKLHRLL
jgi:mannose-1-phosphate guanylyltransferase